MASSKLSQKRPAAAAAAVRAKGAAAVLKRPSAGKTGVRRRPAREATTPAPTKLGKALRDAEKIEAFGWLLGGVLRPIFLQAGDEVRLEQRMECVADAVLAMVQGQSGGEAVQNPLLACHEFVDRLIPDVMRTQFQVPPEKSSRQHRSLARLAADLPSVLVKAAGAGCWVSSLYPVYLQLIVEPLQRAFACGLPGETALDCLAKHAEASGGIVELGAGSGYWAKLLRERGVDVVAFDSKPPGVGAGNDLFVKSFSTVQLATKEAIAAAAVSRRMLLLVWPFNEAKERQTADGGNCWDACALHNFTGDVVAHVGDLRKTCGSGDSGVPWCVTTSDDFQRLLRQEFCLEDEVTLPNFLHYQDTLTVWRRRSARGSLHAS
eukprot:TRINITY_DN42063_c0_g1_i1.p1 TRINITY_DN42063_c0_g1~~TRINITY_DN42063_c0_g1_i1.p1  ORF type:complete len:377 (-),score=96.56 TRINITY_DN42063_c0_g1_i1:529-1659(-)